MGGMLRFSLLLSLMLCALVLGKRRQHKDKSSKDDLGGQLISALRNDVNIDLSADEEYEDLRAELLAYHSALASIAPTRRSMKTTPCWQLGGICVDHKMCEGQRFLTQVNGCRNNLEVCCFKWNNFHVRDMNDKGLDTIALPWSKYENFGGKGVVAKFDKVKKRKKTPKRKYENDDIQSFETSYIRKPLHHIKSPIVEPLGRLAGLAVAYVWTSDNVPHFRWTLEWLDALGGTKSAAKFIYSVPPQSVSKEDTLYQL
uniref:Uncharacterized protein n=1 Tax=Heliothis virescens TaxID=7102 RepID=A0A2A4JUM8_HELVI